MAIDIMDQVTQQAVEDPSGEVLLELRGMDIEAHLVVAFPSTTTKNTLSRAI